MRIFTLCLGIVMMSISTPLLSQMDFVENELLVQFEPKSNVDAIVDQYHSITGPENGIKVEKLLSAPMNIYLLRFDAESTSAKALLRIFRADKAVLNAQLNHYVYPRETTPDDENFDQQWHHVNDGSNGGIENADIDSDLAWDITTGGLTALGDTIVACVIEGGNLLHPDLIGNAWFNHGEIPENGIDDDDNGYVDDYRGWDVSTQSDEGVYNGGHGTNVMGMIGAKGDNALGAAGANWDVKIMSVSGESLFDEVSVIEAYTYPLVQRKLYDETDGERGAFVVVTNASWGIDNGNPDDVPLWSAYYDTLGVYGILSCGATANNNVNIDEVGDIPTGVDSEYMVSVTATNNADVRTFSGFGIETVDLGAPGQSVYTTAGADEYTNTSGTSFASPLTAGVIALLYSAPCESFAQMVRDNPQLGADYVRYALFNGVDPVENLADEVMTGGRLNAFNSLEILMNNCGADLCLPPFSFNYALTEDTVYTFSWNLANEGDAAIRYRMEGEEIWTYVEGISEPEYVFSGLDLCTTYEVEIAAQCDPEENVENLVFSSTQTFETLGCCIAPEVVVESELAETSVDFTWETDFAIPGYDVYFKLSDDEEFELAGTSEDGLFTLENLEECAFYDVVVVQNCSEDIESGYELSFRTKGCGHCIDAEFCPSLGENSSEEYINSVTVGDFENVSGNNDGYILFEELGLELELAGEYETELVPGFPGPEYTEYFKLWIDLNQDGVYTDDEILLESEEGSSEPVTGTVTVPDDALLGDTRMRVSMKYVGGFGAQDVQPCEQFSWGETEDYCITLVESTVGLEDSKLISGFELYPNPNTGNFQIHFEKTPGASSNSQSLQHNGLTFEVMDLAGKVVFSEPVNYGTNDLSISVAAGAYIYRLSNNAGNAMASGKLMLTK